LLAAGSAVEPRLGGVISRNVLGRYAVRSKLQRESSLIATMKDTEHHQPVAIEAILKDISGIEHPQYDLAVFITLGNAASELRVIGKDLGLRDDFLRTIAASDG